MLTKAFVTDIPDMDAPDAFVADPFVVKDGDTFYMFFEAYNGHAYLAYGTSTDLLDWSYGSRLFLDGDAWLSSYPFVFRCDGEWWLVHNDDTTIKLYRPQTWPHTWITMRTLWEDASITMRDVSLFQWQTRWYMIAFDLTHTNCRLYHSDTLYGTAWSEHPTSPILSGADYSRPGGRPIVRPGVGVDILIQDGDPYYGIATRIFRLSNLSATTCAANELETSPVLQLSGVGWNSHGMHHLDRISPSISIVDGFDENGVYSIGLYEDVP